jgi:hypothetical protein
VFRCVYLGVGVFSNDYCVSPRPPCSLLQRTKLLLRRKHCFTNTYTHTHTHPLSQRSCFFVSFFSCIFIEKSSFLSVCLSLQVTYYKKRLIPPPSSSLLPLPFSIKIFSHVCVCVYPSIYLSLCMSYNRASLPPVGVPGGGDDLPLLTPPLPQRVSTSCTRSSDRRPSDMSALFVFCMYMCVCVSEWFVNALYEIKKRGKSTKYVSVCIKCVI